MTQFPSPAPDDSPEAGKQQEKRKARLVERLKFLGFVALLTAMCAVFIWFIFRPDGDAPSEGADGLNYSIPEASPPVTEGDKRKAIETVEMEEKQSERVRNLMDFGEMFGHAEPAPEEMPSLTESAPATSARPADDPIRQSQQTAVRLNEQLRTFYDEPEEDPEVAELRRQVEGLTELVRLQQSGGTDPRTLDEVALIEKSYEMASRYLPTQAGAEATESPAPAGGYAEPPREVADVRRAGDGTVSSLSEFELTAQERNYGFMTAVGAEAVEVSNAIRACVDEDRVVTAGAQVRLRLLEPLRAGGMLLPVNTPLYAHARIEGQRLTLVVTTIESEGNIIPVELTVHDMDGQTGLNIPGSMERTAAKEALASIGQGFGTSISFASSAGQQIAMDLTRGVMNGASQYLSSKIREVKIRLKAGYQVLLISKE